MQGQHEGPGDAAPAGARCNMNGFDFHLPVSEIFERAACQSNLTLIGCEKADIRRLQPLQVERVAGLGALAAEECARCAARRGRMSGLEGSAGRMSSAAVIRSGPC